MPIIYFCLYDFDNYICDICMESPSFDEGTKRILPVVLAYG